MNLVEREYTDDETYTERESVLALGTLWGNPGCLASSTDSTSGRSATAPGDRPSETAFSLLSDVRLNYLYSTVRACPRSGLPLRSSSPSSGLCQALDIEQRLK